MIRGAIEIAGRSVVSGWMYSPEIDLRGQTVFAFIGDRHIGTGRIEIMRRDIKAAGLGDGTSGFYFLVNLQPSDDPGAIVVRLQDSDLSLLQTGASVAPRLSGTEAKPLYARSEHPPSRKVETSRRQNAARPLH